MRAILRFVARLLGATLVTTVVLISLTTTAAAARTRGLLADGHTLSGPALVEPAATGTRGIVFEAALAQAPPPRLQPVTDAQTTPWTVVAWLATGVLLVVAAGVTLTVVGRLRAGRSGTNR
jgi:hypothetical protein